jgi:hypothetical protein
MKNVVLYHGTLTSLAPSIMREGLKPRGKTTSHDEYMNSASLPQFVYLTSSAGIALEHACRISERTASGVGVTVFTIDTDTLDADLIYPDEDYLAEEWNSDFTDWSLREQLRFMKAKQDTWQESLDMFKTIAYRGTVRVKTIHPVPDWAIQMKRDKFRKRIAANA